MSDRPRATVAARQQQPELVPPAELERIRCAARSGLHEPVVLRLLEHVAIQDRVIHAIARRTEEVGTPDEQARVAAARELADPQAPIHIRLEFDYVVPPSIGGAQAIEAMREWSLDGVVNLAVIGRVTATYRGERESWEAGLP